MKFIMTGGGESTHFKKIDEFFIKQLGKSPTLLFIPLAGEEVNWGDGLERIKTVFSTIRFENIEMCVDLSQLDWNYLKKFNAIYIDGGNTFELMSQIRNTHTFEILHKFLHHGGIINGDSAGAIVLGSHIETAHFGESGDLNESSVISYQGLNLLGRWAIHCHYIEDEDNQIIEFSNEFGFPVLALHEETAIYINDNELRVIGEKKLSVFRDRKKIDIFPGNTFKLI